MTTETTWANFVTEIANNTNTTEERRDILERMIAASNQYPDMRNGERTNTAWIKHYAHEALNDLDA